MKKTLLISCIISLAFWQLSFAQHTITIKGKVENYAENLWVKVIKNDGFVNTSIDSVLVKPDGTYKLKMNVLKPGIYSLNCDMQRVSFWGENENLEVNFKGKNTSRMMSVTREFISVKGGRNNELINEHTFISTITYNLEVQWIGNTYNLLNKDMDAYMKNMREVVSLDTKVQRDAMATYLLNKYADCNSAVILLSSFKGDKLNDAVQKIRTANPGNPLLAEYLKQIEENEAAARKMEVGQVAPAFAYKNQDGKLVRLTDFKGKMVIIDFWASWCGPCRAEIPNLKKTYETYHSKGVEFLSVSIDQDDAKWRKAMQEENMPWAQICADDVGKQLMKDYQFNGIPFIILLDEEGKILAKQLRGNMLSEAIDKHLKNK